jgi:uncharacterized membrane protein
VAQQAQELARQYQRFVAQQGAAGAADPSRFTVAQPGGGGGGGGGAGGGAGGQLMYTPEEDELYN